MDPSIQQSAQLAALDAKLNTLLPSLYEDCYQEVEPASMGSAGLKFEADGRVAWHDIWTTFCDLALAGGPPHRGTLLEPAPEQVVFSEPEKYNAVVQEIGRGIWSVTGLPVIPNLKPGWIGVRCASAGMAGWLTRSIVAENVLARHDRAMLQLPAGPHFRLAKEIKNVVVALAKTNHYWSDHMPADKEASIVSMLEGAELMEPASTAQIEAAPGDYQTVVQAMQLGIHGQTGLSCVPPQYSGWIGVECRDPLRAIWLLRAMIVENVLARRETSVLFLPTNPAFLAGERLPNLVTTFARAVELMEFTMP